jgi:porin
VKRFVGFAWLLAPLTLLSPGTGSAQATPPDRPVTVEAKAVVDMVGIASGGDARGVRVLREADVAVQADLGALLGWRGGRAQVRVMSVRGGRPNDLAGTLQGIDNIEVSTPQTSIYEAWIEQTLAGGHISLLAGLTDLNAEFYQNDSAGLLIAPAFGIGSELAASGPNGPSIFPATALAARIKVMPSDSTYLQAGIFNARTGVSGEQGGLDFSMHKGALVIAEAGYTGRFKVASGVWRYTSHQPGFADDSEETTETSQGAYILVDYPLLDGGDQGMRLNLFARAGLSDGATTPYRGGWQGGVLIGGLFRGRPASSLSFGINQGILSDRYCLHAREADGSAAGTETGFEITYSDRILPNVSLQPDVQYIIGASGAKGKDVVVLGLRLTVAFPGD